MTISQPNIIHLIESDLAGINHNFRNIKLWCKGLFTTDNTWTGIQTFGDTASSADFPRAEVVVSQADTTVTDSQNIGLVGEANADATYNGYGILGIGRTSGVRIGAGVYGFGYVEGIGDSAASYGGYFLSTTSHTGGNNVAVYAYAVNAAGAGVNYSFYGAGGKFYNAGDGQFTGALTLGTALSYANGGTGQSAWTKGDILYADNNNSLARLGIGAADQILKVAAGLPSWAANTPSGTEVDITELTDYSWHVANQKYYDWQFEEGTGTTAYASNLNINLAGVNNPGWGNDGDGYTDLDDVVGSYWNVADNANLEPGTGNFTVISVVDYDEDPAWAHTLFCKSIETAANNHFRMAIDSNEHVNIRIGSHAELAGTTEMDINIKYMIWMRRTGTLLEAGVTPVSASVFDTTKDVSHVVDPAESAGVNATSAYIGYNNDGSARYSDMQVYRTIVFPTYAVSDAELAGIFYNIKKITPVLRGLVSADSQMPTSASGTNKVFSTTTDMVYSIEDSGLQNLSGGIKIGSVDIISSYLSCAVANKYFSKYKCLHDCIITHLATSPISLTVNINCVMAIYSSYASRPFTMLAQTSVHVLKQVDEEGTILLKLTTPVKLQMGREYWLAWQSQTTAILLSIGSVTSLAQSNCYFASAYTGTFADVPITQALTAVSGRIYMAGV
jgi:hypothetical protein